MKQKADLLIYNAAELLTIKGASKKPKTGKQMHDLGIWSSGAVACFKGKIVAVGKTNLVNKEVLLTKNAKKINASGKTVMPGFVDSHTHALFSGWREKEFELKIRGKSYMDILKHGGGILSTVEKTRKASKNQLLKEGFERLNRIMTHGTTTMEIKSGYGLDKKNELKILGVINQLNKKHPMDIVTTFLGAHTVPKNFKSTQEFVDHVMKIIPDAANFAEYNDVFCEKGIFSAKQAERILIEGKKFDLKPRIHSEQFNSIGGIRVAKKVKAVSVDHLDVIKEKDIKTLKKSGSIGILLPGVSFFLKAKKHAPAQKLIKARIPIAIATDFNPGSCPCESMQFMLTLACLNMKLTPAQAINAATINAAHALERADKIGSLEKGKQADIIILNTENHKQIPYKFGTNLVEKVIKKGKIVIANSV